MESPKFRLLHFLYLFGLRLVKYQAFLSYKIISEVDDCVKFLCSNYISGFMKWSSWKHHKKKNSVLEAFC